MKKLLFKKSAVNHYFKSLPLLLVCFISFFFLTSFKTQNALLPLFDAKFRIKVSQSVPVQTDYLEVLYFTHDELKTLIKPGKKIKKIVFQFYRESDGTFTALAWRTRRKVRNVDTSTTILKLQVYKGYAQKISIAASFGNQETTKKEFEALKQAIDTPKAKYILMVPRTKKIAGYFHYYFEFRYTDKDPGSYTTKDIDTDSYSLGINLETNPSPPYHGY